MKCWGCEACAREALKRGGTGRDAEVLSVKLETGLEWMFPLLEPLGTMALAVVEVEVEFVEWESPRSSGGVRRRREGGRFVHRVSEF